MASGTQLEPGAAARLSLNHAFLPRPTPCSLRPLPGRPARGDAGLRRKRVLWAAQARGTWHKSSGHRWVLALHRRGWEVQCSSAHSRPPLSPSPPTRSCCNHSCAPNAEAFKRDEDEDGRGECWGGGCWSVWTSAAAGPCCLLLHSLWTHQLRVPPPPLAPPLVAAAAVVLALRPIAAGEEVTLSYIGEGSRGGACMGLHVAIGSVLCAGRRGSRV